MAGRARAAGRGARDARQRPAPDRLPRRRGRARSIARSRKRRAQLARGAPADDRPGRQRDTRRHVPGRGRQHRALPRPAQAGRLPRPGPARSASPATRPPRHGHISKQGSPPVRHALGRGRLERRPHPGPVARLLPAHPRPPRPPGRDRPPTARKLACLFWRLLWREQDYAFGQPSLTAKKIRRLEITAGAPRWQDRTGVGPPTRIRDAERDLARQAETRLRADRPRPPSRRSDQDGRERDTGARITKALKGKAARQTTSP